MLQKIIFRITITSIFLLAACNGGGPATDVSSITPTTFGSAGTAEPTATSGPTRVLYIGSDESNSLQAEFETLAAQSGLTFEQQDEFRSADLDGTVRAVILFGLSENTGEVITQHPDVGFFVAGGEGSVQGGNVYPISQSQAGRDQVAFLAGYMAAVTTFDWRVGVVALDGSTGSVDLPAFTAGVQYFCGWCRPVYPPYIEYPQSLTVSQADAANGQTTANVFNEAGVDTVFVPVELATIEFVRPLAEAGMAIISSAEPIDGLQSQWMATIRVTSGVGLQLLWEAMMAGEPAPTSSGVVELSHLNAAMISSGRADLVRQVAEELQSGFIDTGSPDME